MGPAAPFAHRRPALTITLVGAESLAIGAVMPEVANELGERWLYGWVFSAFSLGSLVGVTSAGRIADRAPALGVPSPSAWGCFAGASGRRAHAVHAVLVLARSVQGLQAGVLPATAYVCIARLSGNPSTSHVRAARDRVARARRGRPLDRGGGWPALGMAVGVPRPTSDRGGVRGARDPGRARAGATEQTTAGPASCTRCRPDRHPAGTALALGGLTASRWYEVVAGPVLGLAVSLIPYRRLTPAGVLRGHHGLPAVIACRACSPRPSSPSMPSYPLRSPTHVEPRRGWWEPPSRPPPGFGWPAHGCKSARSLAWARAASCDGASCSWRVCGPSPPLQ